MHVCCYFLLPLSYCSIVPLIKKQKNIPLCQRGLRNRIPSLDDADQEHDGRYDKEDMDEPSEDVKTKVAKKPEDD
jgi:hypothetical protein